MKTNCILLFAALLAAGRFAAAAQVNVFYEATLLDGTNAASGTFDMKFTLYAESNGGEPIGIAYTNASLRVMNGRVQTLLVCRNEGIRLKRGWVETAIRPAGSEAAFIPMRAQVQDCKTHRAPPGKSCDAQCEFVALRLETTRLPFSFDPLKPHRGRGFIQLPPSLRRATSPSSSSGIGSR